MSKDARNEFTLTNYGAAILETQIFHIREHMKNTEKCLKYLEYVYLGGDPP